jgi:hypothetical protein
MALQVFNLLDYLVTFNTGWFMVSGMVVTFNVFACLILAGSIIYEYGGAID